MVTVFSPAAKVIWPEESERVRPVKLAWPVAEMEATGERGSRPRLREAEEVASWRSRSWLEAAMRGPKPDD